MGVPPTGVLPSHLSTPANTPVSEPAG
jgi:hypothetical protein